MNKAIVTKTETDVNDGASSIMQVIERCALNPNVDVDKMQKLLDMQERILERNAKHAFSMDFVQMKSKLPKVIKTKDNRQTNSKYAPLDEINKIIDPVLNDFGFGTSYKIAQSDKTVTVTAILWHRDGHTEESTITLPLDNAGMQGKVNKTEVHAIASSTTYGKRLALCALLNISTGDADDDGNAAQNYPTPQHSADNDAVSVIKEFYDLYEKMSDDLGGDCYKTYLCNTSGQSPTIEQVLSWKSTQQINWLRPRLAAMKEDWQRMKKTGEHKADDVSFVKKADAQNVKNPDIDNLPSFEDFQLPEDK